MHNRGLFLLLVVMVVLSACARPAGVAVPTAAPVVCDIHVKGRWIVGSADEPLTLYGANLPTLSEMEASAYPVDTRLHDLAAAGATMVRLRVDFREVSPTFVPAKVAPFVQQANQLGMVVLLGWSTVISGSVNDYVDDAEDWVRQEFTYLSNNPGVWFDLYDGMQDVSPTRQRNIAQRLVDVARGYRANNIIVVNDPVWLLEADPAINQPLPASNIVYGVGSSGVAQLGDGYDTSNLPFIVTRWDGDTAGLASLHALQVGALARSVANPIPTSLADFWKANRVDLRACFAK